jgi:L-fuconate dehydratase
VLELHTDDASLTGHGFAFTLGGGTDLVCRAALELSKGLVGRDIAAVMAELGAISFEIANHPQWRWLGPEKGVVSLALASINK